MTAARTAVGSGLPFAVGRRTVPATFIHRHTQHLHDTWHGDYAVKVVGSNLRLTKPPADLADECGGRSSCCSVQLVQAATFGACEHAVFPLGMRVCVHHPALESCKMFCDCETADSSFDKLSGGHHSAGCHGAPAGFVGHPRLLPVPDPSDLACVPAQPSFCGIVTPDNMTRCCEDPAHIGPVHTSTYSPPCSGYSPRRDPTSSMAQPCLRPPAQRGSLTRRHQRRAGCRRQSEARQLPTRLQRAQLPLPSGCVSWRPHGVCTGLRDERQERTLSDITDGARSRPPFIKDIVGNIISDMTTDT